MWGEELLAPIEFPRTQATERIRAVITDRPVRQLLYELPLAFVTALVSTPELLSPTSMMVVIIKDGE